ncbi:hypothetical protein [Sporomusa aerivorans]|uniref:hypothetical protein n=1 Tax=Sporomusa aerivorans TaxID=204936 RepID=UPI00352A482F
MQGSGNYGEKSDKKLPETKFTTGNVGVEKTSSASEKKEQHTIEPRRFPRNITSRRNAGFY